MHLRRNPRRTIRRSTALALGGLVLAAPLLTSCGFDYATDRPYTAANGVNERDASVDVLGAVIVSGQPNSGTFIATFSNNNHEQSNTVESLQGADGTTVQAESFPPITVDKGGLVNLAEQGGIPVSGSFKAGDFVPVTIGFGSGEQVSLHVLVVAEDGIYAGLDSSGSGSGSSAYESPSVSPAEVSGSPSGGVQPAEPPSPSPTE